MFGLKLQKSKQLKNNWILNTLHSVNQVTIELIPKKQEYVRKLTEILSTQTHLEKVVLQLNYYLSQSSSYQLFTALENLTELKDLGIQIQDPMSLEREEARQLGKSLKKLNNLTSFSLSLKSVDVEQKSIALSLKKGIDCLTSLKDLNIDIKKMKNSKMYLLLSEQSNLTSLNLSFQECQFSERICKKWSKSISNLSNLTSLKLSIQGCKMEGAGFGSFTSNLYKLTQLEALEFVFEFHMFSLEEYEYLKLSLRQLNGLKSFSFKVKGYKSYKDYYQNVLEAFDSNLHNQLMIMELSLTIQMSEELGYFQNLNCLKELTLNISFEEFTNEAIRSFFLGMRALVSLKKLKLIFQNFKGGIGQEIGRQFGMSLKRMVMLEDLYLEFPQYHSGIKLGGCLKLGRGLSQLLNLKKLYLLINSDNEIGEEGFSSIGKALKNLINLEKLDLIIRHNNGVNSYGCDQLFSGLSCLVQLVELRLDISNYSANEAFDLNSLSLALQNFSLLTVLNLKGIRVTSEKDALILQDCLSKLISLVDISLQLLDCAKSAYFPMIIQGLKYSSIQKIDITQDRSQGLTLVSAFEELIHLKNLYHFALCAHVQEIDKRKISPLKSILKKVTNLKYVQLTIQKSDLVKLTHELLMKYIKSSVDIQVEGDYDDDENSMDYSEQFSESSDEDSEDSQDE